MDEPDLTPRQRELVTAFVTAYEVMQVPFNLVYTPFAHPNWPADVADPDPEEVRVLVDRGLLRDEAESFKPLWQVAPASMGRELVHGPAPEPKSPIEAWMRRDHRKESGAQFNQKMDDLKRESLIAAGYVEPVSDRDLKRISVTSTGEVTWAPEHHFDETHPDYDPVYGVVMPWGAPGMTEYAEWERERGHLGRGLRPRRLPPRRPS